MNNNYVPRHDVNIREGRTVNYLLQKCLDKFDAEFRKERDRTSQVRKNVADQ